MPHFNRNQQRNLPLGSTMPEPVRQRLQAIKRRIQEENEREGKARRAEALARAERFETWHEVRLSSLPIKHRR